MDIDVYWWLCLLSSPLNRSTLCTCWFDSLAYKKYIACLIVVVKQVTHSFTMLGHHQQTAYQIPSALVHFEDYVEDIRLQLPQNWFTIVVNDTARTTSAPNLMLQMHFHRRYWELCWNIVSSRVGEVPNATSWGVGWIGQDKVSYNRLATTPHHTTCKNPKTMITDLTAIFSSSFWIGWARFDIWAVVCWYI